MTEAPRAGMIFYAEWQAAEKKLARIRQYCEDAKASGDEGNWTQDVLLVLDS